MGLKELFLNKGWAGRTMSRRETVERLDPILRRYHELNHSYDSAINSVSNAEVVQQMEILQKVARVDLGKLSETILSCGGVPYGGIDLESRDAGMGSEDADKDSEDADILQRLRDLESGYEEMLSTELGENHQVRTKAILSAVLGNSRARVEYLRSTLRTYRRPTSTHS